VSKNMEPKREKTESSHAGVPDVCDLLNFKFRAEAVSDVLKALINLEERLDCCVKQLSLEVYGGGVDVTMRVVRFNRDVLRRYGHFLVVTVPLEEIRKAMGEVVDCHVISQSLNYAELYTGESYHSDYGERAVEVKAVRR
jgi:hypothetical protein